MTKRSWVISIMAGLILGLAMLVTHLPQDWTSVVHASPEAEPILNLMLNSPNTWRTARGEMNITFYGRDGSSQTFINKFEVALPYQAYIESEEQGNPNNKMIWISDGDKYYTLDTNQQKFIESAIPAFAKGASKAPTSVSKIAPGVVHGYPFAMIINMPIKDYLFPVYFPQGKGLYTLQGEETIIGQPAWIIMFTYNDNDKDTTNDVTSTAWIDKETGIILKNIIKRPSYVGGIGIEMAFISLDIDKEVDVQKMTKPIGYKFTPFNP